ncbi:MAG: glutaredoxin [uncultured DHVE6 group euryarchaeote]|jgi:glutaredoxin 3|nr:MAG: glutaredoxin [uncultured DHVE6 group euryarchaeote]
MEAEIWTWSFCPFCKDAKKILIENNIEFKEHIMDDKVDELQKIKDKYNHQTVPIILLNGNFIGGCDELIKLEKSGKLN